MCVQPFRLLENKPSSRPFVFYLQLGLLASMIGDRFSDVTVVVFSLYFYYRARGFLYIDNNKFLGQICEFSSLNGELIVWLGVVRNLLVNHS